MGLRNENPEPAQPFYVESSYSIMSNDSDHWINWHMGQSRVRVFGPCTMAAAREWLVGMKAQL